MAEIQAMSMAGFLSGHGHLFSEEEQALIRGTPSNDIYGFSWSPLPPYPRLALAVDGLRFVGGLSLHRYFAAGEYAVIEPMNVLPSYQRQGVGTKLWDFVAAYSTGIGDRGLQVWALDGNSMAMSFYKKKVGCSAIGPGKWWLGNHVEPATGFQLDFPPLNASARTDEVDL